MLAKVKLVINYDPAGRGSDKPVMVTIDPPDWAVSKGWGATSWLRR